MAFDPSQWGPGTLPNEPTQTFDSSATTADPQGRAFYQAFASGDPIGAMAADDPKLTSALAFVKQYDPNASIGLSAPTDNEGSDNVQQYQLNFDQSKLPKMPTGMTLAPDAQSQAAEKGSWNTGGGAGDIQSVKDPSKVTMDPFYGAVTSPDNISQNPIAEKKNAVDTYGPLVVGGIAGLGAFDPELGFLGGGMDLGGSGGMGQFLGNAAQSVMGGLQNNNGQLNPLGMVEGLGGAALGGLGNSIPGLGNIMSYLKYIPMAMNAAKNPVGTAANYGINQGASYLGKLFQGS